MSDTIWINIRNGETRESNKKDHSAIFDLTKHFDNLAALISVKPLSNFYDDTDLRYNFDEDGEFEESDSGWSNEAAKWFQADEGLATINNILSHLIQFPNAIDYGIWNHAEVMEELEDCRTELLKAAERRLPFHFSIVM